MSFVTEWQLMLHLIRLFMQIHVKLYRYGCPSSHTQWFRHGDNCTSRSGPRQKHFPAYIRAAADKLTMKDLQEVNKNSCKTKQLILLEKLYVIHNASIYMSPIMWTWLTRTQTPVSFLSQKLKSDETIPDFLLKMQRNDGAMYDDVKCKICEIFLNLTLTFASYSNFWMRVWYWRRRSEKNNLI